MSGEKLSQGISEADLARAELYDTLAKLRDRLDYAQRVDDGVDRAKLRIAEFKRESPALFTAGVVGVAAASGLVVWAITRKVVRLLS